MTDPQFHYQALLKSQSSSEVTSLIAFRESATTGLQAVIWHAAQQKWVYAPPVAATLLYDDSSATESQPVDRPTAERLAREHLHTNLPTPEQLTTMIEAATPTT